MAYPPLPTVKEIDLEKYTKGPWYEIARLDTPFEKDASDVTAEYYINGDGTLRVENRAIINGQERIAIGRARAIDSTNTKLKVSFLPSCLSCLDSFAAGDYWILKIDRRYRTVMVGTPCFRYLWILHRNPSLDRGIFDEYREKANALGFDVSGKKLIMTPQSQRIDM